MDRDAPACQADDGGRLSYIQSVLIPGLALIAAMLMLYTGMASFTLRPKIDTRLRPMVLITIVGILMGGMLFSRLVTWAERKRTTGRVAVLAVWLAAALLTVLPGFDHYIGNEPLRMVANLCLGLEFAPAYYLFSTRFPVAWRGFVFGLGQGSGLLLWNILTRPPLSSSHFQTFHPSLPTIYYIHFISIAVLAGVSMYSFVIRPCQPRSEAENFAPELTNIRRKSLIRLFAAAMSSIYILSGILSGQLLPSVLLSDQPMVHYLGIGFAIIVSPISGWLADRKRVWLFRRFLPVFCWIIILSPSLAAFGYGPGMVNVLRALVVALQWAFFVISSAAFIGLASTPGESARLVCINYSIRFLAVFAYIAWVRVLHVSQGGTIFAALGLAYFTYLLLERISKKIANLVNPDDDAAVEPNAEAPDEAEMESDATDTPPDNPAASKEENISAFLLSGELTQREVETATMLLRGVPILDISAAMNISERTVKKHTASIYQKFDVRNRHELYRLYVSSLQKIKDK